MLKKQIMEIFRGYFYNSRKGRGHSKIVTAIYIALFALLMVGVLGGMFTVMALTLCAPMAEAGMDWLYFALMGLLSVLLGAFCSVFTTYSGLYLAKDNDLLLSMPIPVSAIMVARLLGVYLMGLMYSAVVIVPAVIVYWATVSARAGVIVGSLLLIALISLFVLTISCILGWVVARISVKLKNKSFMTVLLSIALIAVYYFFYYKAQSLIGGLLADAALFGARIKGSAYGVYLFGSVALGNGRAMLGVSLAVMALWGLTWAIMARSFLTLSTASGAVSRRVYREKRVRCCSLNQALLGREMSHFLSSPNYMLNCGLSSLLLLAAGVALLIKGRDVLLLLQLVLPGKAGGLSVLGCAAVCLIASMNDMAAPSVSLEGKTLWQIQSLPVGAWAVLRAKLALQMLFTGIPALFCTLCAAVVCRVSALEGMLMLVLTLLYALLTASLSLTMGLLRPNLSWTNELAPIKQSLAVMLALLGNMLCALLLGGGYFVMPLSETFYLALACGVTALGSALLLNWLKRRGRVIFERLA